MSFIGRSRILIFCWLTGVASRAPRGLPAPWLIHRPYKSVVRIGRRRRAFRARAIVRFQVLRVGADKVGPAVFLGSGEYIAVFNPPPQREDGRRVLTVLCL